MSANPPFDRLSGLTPHVQRLALGCQHWLEHGDLTQATALLDAAIGESPAHPELLRLCGLTELSQGRPENAVALLRKAASAWPQDGLIESNLGAALAERGDIDAAVRAFRRATELDPLLIEAWFNLGRALELGHDAEGAHAAFSAVLELDAAHRPARILRAETLKTLGQLADAETELRIVLRDDPESVPAWVALVNLKSFRATDDLRGLEHVYRAEALTPVQRIDIGFAYANVLEASGHYAEAFDVFDAANTAKRKTFRWDSAAVSALVDDILAAFAAADPAIDKTRGSDIVFLVGMPRSGSTLGEQILAAHPAVTAGGETGWLAQILQGESRRRGMRFPYWVAQASPDDWFRLGDEYLTRVAASRRDATATFTDKTLTNWQTLGAIRRMLPGARIVHCLRDPLETAWSCYKHNFAGDQLYSYEIGELAAFFGDATRAMHFWDARYPGWILAHRHEMLIADPQAATVALLAHCGLPFDQACLRFHEVEREVRTASAAQVRTPLRTDTVVAARYGGLLDPLRQALAAHGIVGA